MLRGIYLITIFLLMLGCACGNQHYVFAPQVIREGAYENIVVSLHGVEGRVKVVASVNLGGIANFDKDNQDATKPIIMQIKYDRNNAPKEPGRKKYAELIITVTQDGKQIYQTKLKMQVIYASGYLYVQTNRPIYRPKEFVRFRIAALTNSYTPDRTKKVKVVFRIPLENVGISEETYTMSDDDKFIEGQFELPEFPVFGIWSIEAKYEDDDGAWSTRTFDVRPYVLPTFNVRVILVNPYILVKKNMQDQHISGKITAQYSYGRNVYGNYYIAAKLKRPHHKRAIPFYRYPSSGKQAKMARGGVVNFKIKTTSVLNAIADGDNPTFEKLRSEGATITIEVSVTGQDDGNIESDKSMAVPFVISPYVINIDRMTKYFTRGTSFEIKADLLDSVTGQPVQNGIRVNVKGPIACGSMRCPDGQCCKNGGCAPCAGDLVNSDENGQINYNINMDGTNQAKTFKIETADLDVDPENQASLEFTLHPYASENVLQLSAKRKIATVGDKAFQVEIRYKTAPSEFRYIISARGRLVSVGRAQPQPNTIQHTLHFTIQSDMVPSFRLFVYFISGSEMVSNSLWVDVKDACKKELKVTVPDEVLPGQAFEVNFDGSGSALIGVSAVDRAAYYLYGEGRLTRNSVFEGLNQYDRGCVREGGIDAKHVFEIAGFQVVSNAKPFLAKEDFLYCDALKRHKRAAPNQVAQAVFEEEVVDPACEMDAVIELYTSEGCVSRAERVRDRKGRNCSAVFVAKCKDNEMQKNFARNSIRSAAGNARSAKALETVRSNFEESLRWSTEMLDPAGFLTLDLTAKHSITTFEFDAVSMHPEDGFCVAQTQNMTIFQNVFIKLHVPYALKRREQTQIRMTVFNYATESKKLRLEVMTGADICSHFPEGKFSEIATVTMRPNSAIGFSFVVLPLRIPKTNEVQIEAKVYDSENKAIDHIRRSIRVEPEGEVREMKGTKTFDLRKKRSVEFTFNLTFPENFVLDTRKCWLYPYSNFMGPIIQIDPVTSQPKNDIHSIIRMPGGCGEQTMLSMGPNVYAHKYLRSVGRMLPDSPEYKGSIEKMKAGFANQLNYRCNCVPKVWSVFPQSAPSVWLNAYVNKVFAQAKVFHTTMDKTPICASVNWLTTLQNADGSFQSGGRVIHQEMHGAVGSKLTLTAYVLMSLVQSVSLCDDDVKTVESAIMKAIGYLDSHKNDRQMNQPYAIALIAYSMTIADTNHPYSKAIRAKLLTKFEYSDDMRLAFLKGAPLATIQGTGTHPYWYQRKPLAIDIEATGYALMALVWDAGINKADQRRFDLTRKIVLWLIEQRDENGGFTTTQDTVVGLEALADYMIWSNAVQPNEDKVDISLTISSPPGTEFYDPPFRLHLDKKNENVTSPIPVPRKAIGKGILNIRAEGKGEGTISYRCVYRTMVDEEACHFDLSVNAEIYREKVNREAGAEKPVLVELSIKISKPNGDPVGQSIVEVTLLSGYVADEQSLERMSQEKYVDGIVERFEISNQKVVLYLQEIAKKEITLGFLIRRHINVKDPQPATVKVYHYYEPSISCSKFYALPNNVPRLRTTPCKDENGQGSEDMCKCAEGGCMTCRTRKDQLEKTLCIPGLNEKCQLCKEPKQENCFNLTKMACASSYVYVVNITDSVKDTTGVFVGFKARIETLYKRGPDATAKSNVERDFVTRTDCYKTCKDDILKKGNARDNEVIFHVPGRRMLMIGQEIEESVDKNDNPLIRYNLKEGDYAERIYPKEKCKEARQVVNGLCKKKKKTKKQKEKCKKNRAVNQSCTNLQLLRRMLIRGCDTL